MGAPRSERRASLLLGLLALTLPVGALLQPLLLPSRSELPVVPRQLEASVILITVAGLRADRVGHLAPPGVGAARTPHLDRLAETGISFTQAWSSSNESRAATAALLTGACPAQTGVRGRQDVLPAAAVTIAELAQQAGVATGAVFAHPAHAGVGFDQGFAERVDARGADADAAFARALELLDGPLARRALLWVDLGDLRAPWSEAELAAAIDAPSRAALAARYDEALAGLDAALGRFLQALAERARLETLMLVVAGTAGLRLDEEHPPRFVAGADLSEASIAVPTILRLPARFMRGQRLERLAASVDLAPTIVELGLRLSWTAPAGKSLNNAVRYQHAPVRESHAEGRHLPADGGPPFDGHALRIATHKLVSDADGLRAEVYLLEQDPLARRPAAVAPIVLDALLRRDAAWRAACARP